MDNFGNKGIAGLWLGLTDEYSEGSFRWVTGDPAWYRNWAPGKPNNYEHSDVELDDYVHMWSDNSWNGWDARAFGTWNDAPNDASIFSEGRVFAGLAEISFCAIATEGTPTGMPLGAIATKGTPTGMPSGAIANEGTPTGMPSGAIANKGTPTGMPSGAIANEGTPTDMPSLLPSSLPSMGFDGDLEIPQLVTSSNKHLYSFLHLSLGVKQCKTCNLWWSVILDEYHIISIHDALRLNLVSLSLLKNHSSALRSTCSRQPQQMSIRSGQSAVMGGCATYVFFMGMPFPQVYDITIGASGDSVYWARFNITKEWDAMRIHRNSTARIQSVKNTSPHQYTRRDLSWTIQLISSQYSPAALYRLALQLDVK
jgi:hypothetical protein